MAFDDVRVVHITEDLDLPTDLTADVLFVVPVDDFESIRARRRAVDDFVNGASRAASYSVDPVEFGEADLGSRSGCVSVGVGVGGG